MAYSSGDNAKFQGSSLGAMGGTTAYQEGQIKGIATPVPRTISSALSRMDTVGERLVKVREHLNALSDQIGGPRPTEANGLKGQAPQPSGAVHRLNDAADRANDIVGDIEDLLGSISRALG